MAAPLLDAQRVVLKIRGTDHSVTVDGEAVLWSPVPGCRGDRGCASLCDVVGATADGAAVHVVSYPKRQPWCGGPGGTRAERRDRFAAPSAAEAAAFAERVRAAAAGGRRPRRFLVFVNPKSGQGLSPALYAKKVAPMLAAAGAAVEYVPTAHAGHATEVCAAHGLDGIDAVVAVGGDGLLYECVQGLASRSDADEVLARVALAPVPGGTGNGLAKTLLEASRERYDVTSAVFLLLKGTPKPVDLGHALVEGEAHPRTTFLSTAYGIAADADLESENYRYLGVLRLTVGALVRMIWLRKYTAKLAYEPLVDGKPPVGGPPLPASLAEPVPAHWAHADGEFVMLWALHVTHPSHDMFVAPGATLDDGLLHIYLVRSSCKPASLLGLFLKIETGQHVGHPDLEVIRTRAFRLVPDERATTRGIFMVDGEKAGPGALQHAVRPKAGRALVL